MYLTNKWYKLPLSSQSLVISGFFDKLFPNIIEAKFNGLALEESS